MEVWGKSLLSRALPILILEKKLIKTTKTAGTIDKHAHSNRTFLEGDFDINQINDAVNHEKDYKRGNHQAEPGYQKRLGKRKEIQMGRG